MNPRAAINDLHPFQGCPFGQLGYFSKSPESLWVAPTRYELRCPATAESIVTCFAEKCKYFFQENFPIIRDLGIPFVLSVLYFFRIFVEIAECACYNVKKGVEYG